MVQTLEITNPQMDGKWSSLIRTKINSFTKWDLVRFFHDNPHTRDTAENIASFLGRDPQAVKIELSELVRAKVLESDESSEGTIFRLSSKKEVRQIISEFIHACHNRDFRMQVIRIIQTRQVAHS